MTTDSHSVSGTPAHPAIPWVAWFANAVFLFVLLSFVVAFLGTQVVLVEQQFAVSVGIALLSLALSGIYLRLYASATSWDSPGEIFVGRLHDSIEKPWRNPFHRNRLPVLLWQAAFLAYFLSLWWRSLAAEDLGVIATKAAVTFVLTRALLSWGRGEKTGGVLLASYLLLHAGAQWFEAQSEIRFVLLAEVRPLGALIPAVVVALGCLWTALAYGPTRPQIS